MKSWTHAAAVVCTCALFLTACSGTKVGEVTAADYNEDPLTVVIPANKNDADAIEAAERALVGRGWTVMSKTPSEIVGHLRHRNFDATTNIKIEGDKLVFYSDASYVGPQVEDPTPGVPYGWLKNLQNDAQLNLMN